MQYIQWSISWTVITHCLWSKCQLKLRLTWNRHKWDISIHGHKWNISIHGHKMSPWKRGTTRNLLRCLMSIVMSVLSSKTMLSLQTEFDTHAHRKTNKWLYNPRAWWMHVARTYFRFQACMSSGFYVSELGQHGEQCRQSHFPSMGPLLVSRDVAVELLRKFCNSFRIGCFNSLTILVSSMGWSIVCDNQNK